MKLRPAGGLFPYARRIAKATTAIQRVLTGKSAFGDAAARAKRSAAMAGSTMKAAAAAATLKPRSSQAAGSSPSGFADSRPEPSSGPPGAQFLSGTFANSFGSRPYRLYVPASYKGRDLVPLIVMLHGCTQSPEDFAAGTGMNLAAETHACLVAYPGQPRSAHNQKCWNWYSEGDQQRDRGEPSLIAGITRRIVEEYAVDPRRVYVAGFSAGGAAAAILGETYPDLYVAVGVHSGLACGSAHDLNSALAAMKHGAPGKTTAAGRTPIIIFHGDRDGTVSPRNADAVAEPSIQDGPSTTEEGVVPGGRKYTRRCVAGPDGTAVIEQWLVQGGGHAWSGGQKAGSYTDPTGPDATAEMLRFFLQHSRPA